MLSRFTEPRWMARKRRQWRSNAAVQTRIERVMCFDGAAGAVPLGKDAPRSLPGHPEFVKSGWTEHMLFRYLLAMDYCSGLEVLDSCSGLGWGSYLVSAVARRVTGIDLDEASTRFALDAWREPNLAFVTGSVLALPFEPGRFDVVLCMEALEHFSARDGATYLSELRRVCRSGGVIAGSSTFPDTRLESRWMCRGNPHHLYIHTRSELERLLKDRVGEPLLITRHYFVARCAD